MIIEACFTRCGQPIPMRVEKFDYLFTENHYGDFVCNVVSDDHAKHMIETGNFKEYVPPTKEELRAKLNDDSENWATKSWIEDIVSDAEEKVSDPGAPRQKRESTKKGGAKK